MSNQYEIDRAGTSAQRAQSEMMKALGRTVPDIKKMIENLVKSFGKGKDSSIEIKVDGKTKLKGQVKDGVFTASKNELSADEIKSLKAYFASLPNPVLKPKDFEVMVDNRTVLKTENGAVVSQATPERTVAAQQAFEAVQAPSVRATEAPAQSPAPSASPVATPVQTPAPQSTAEAKPLQTQQRSPQPEPTKAESVPTPVGVESKQSAPVAAQRIVPSPNSSSPVPGEQASTLTRAQKQSFASLEDIEKQLVDIERRSKEPGMGYLKSEPHTKKLENYAEELKKELEKSGISSVRQSSTPTQLEPTKAVSAPTPVTQEAAPSPVPQPEAGASSIPKDKTGLIPPDYGIESAKGISWDTLKASGDQALMRSYGSLENVREDLNKSYERASHPGFEWLAKVPHIAGLEQRLAAEIPVFEAKLKESIKEGKYPDPRTSATTQPETKTIPGLDADLKVPQNPDQNRNNRDLLEKAKCSLALLSDRPSGEREWVGKDYALAEGKDGSFRVTHQSRGEILNFANGKVTGQATTQDVAKLNDLLAVAKQTHVPQQKQPEQKKSLAVGGIKS